MLLDVNNACLLVVDIQEKLVPFVQNNQDLIKNCRWLLEVANQMDVPILASEQYPQGLGSTVSDLKLLIPNSNFMQKVHFSSCAENQCLHKIMETAKNQIVIIGIEAHICVLQTALELTHFDEKQVFVVADCISSRGKFDLNLALDRMRFHGIQIISKEMVFFEWLRQAGTDQFRELNKRFMK